MSFLNQTVSYFKNNIEVLSKVVDLEENLLILENNDKISPDIVFPFPSDNSYDKLFIKNLPSNYNFKNPYMTLSFLHPKGFFNLSINFQKVFTNLNSMANPDVVATKFHKFVYELIDSLEKVESDGETTTFKSNVFKCFVIISLDNNTIITIKSKTPSYYKLRKKHENPQEFFKTARENGHDSVLKNKVNFILTKLKELGFNQNRAGLIRSVANRSNLRIILDITASRDIKISLDFNTENQTRSYKKLNYSEITDFNKTINSFIAYCENDNFPSFEETKENFKQTQFPEILKSLIDQGLTIVKLNLDNGNANLLLTHNNKTGKVELSTNKKGVMISLISHNSPLEVIDLNSVNHILSNFNKMIEGEIKRSDILEEKTNQNAYSKEISQIKSLGYEVKEINKSGTIILAKKQYIVRIITSQKKASIGFDVLNQDKMGQVPMDRIKDIPYFIKLCEEKNKTQRYCPKLVLKDLNQIRLNMFS